VQIYINQLFYLVTLTAACGGLEQINGEIDAGLDRALGSIRQGLTAPRLG
jgi:hypothetical protein